MNMRDPFEKLFNNFIKKPGAERRQALHICAMLHLNPSSDFLDVLQFTNGGEGFIRQSYLRLYSCAELLSLNEAYQVNRFAPGLVLFESNGGGVLYRDTLLDAAPLQPLIR